jgi:hypothetical protein
MKRLEREISHIMPSCHSDTFPASRRMFGASIEIVVEKGEEVVFKYKKVDLGSTCLVEGGCTCSRTVGGRKWQEAIFFQFFGYMQQRRDVPLRSSSQSSTCPRGKRSAQPPVKLPTHPCRYLYDVIHTWRTHLTNHSLPITN